MDKRLSCVLEHDACHFFACAASWFEQKRLEDKQRKETKHKERIDAACSALVVAFFGLCLFSLFFFSKLQYQLA